MNEELMFGIKKVQMVLGKFHPQQTQNKAITNTKAKYGNHIILKIALSSYFIHIYFGIGFL